jgi:hypothetical protein
MGVSKQAAGFWRYQVDHAYLAWRADLLYVALLFRFRDLIVVVH